ncbi:phage tail tip lysozyme [Bordetella sp. 02P26C-1]|uniref:phage tail tip lysozyme n=1 Tax=Bordetella sp. 02P26C-1 TaxID=2683195 RepID=UPI0013544CB3|nr:phage tail tip lysozyme [Bordetella sp. 02P26C-1]MVW80174.1 hypothetical protein [Bordetella sp. 02P26C-1]
MATVIDALVVTLGLDAKAFKQDQREATASLKHTATDAAKAARDIEARGRQATATFGSWRREVVGLLALFTAGVGIQQFTKNTLASAISLGRMSSNLGVGVDQLQAWQRAAERAGLSVGGMNALLHDTASAVNQLRLGQGLNEQARQFLLAGGSVEDLRDANAYLTARAKIVREFYQRDPSKALYVAQQLGITEEQFNLLKQGPSAIQALVEAQKQRLAITREDAEQATRLNNLWLDLRDTYTAVGTKVVIALIPVFERLIEKGKQLGDKVLANRDAIVAWVDRAVDAIGKFVTMADRAADSVGGWQNVLIALAGLKILSMVGPLLSVAGALAQIGAALVTLGGSAASAGIAALGAAGAAVVGGVALATYSSSLNDGESETVAALNGGANPKGADMVRAMEGMGYKREHAVGIVANLVAESSLNPAAVGDGGRAYGLAQWHPDRQANFKRVFGKDIKGSTVEEQLKFIDWELRNTERKAREKLLAATTPQQAADAFRVHYERPDPKNAARDGAIRRGQAGALHSELYRDDLDRTGNYTDRLTPTSGMIPIGPPTTTNTTNTETNITGPITINTQATDAQGIMRDLQVMMPGRNLNAAQANSGLR